MKPIKYKTINRSIRPYKIAVWVLAFWCVLSTATLGVVSYTQKGIISSLRLLNGTLRSKIQAYEIAGKSEIVFHPKKHKK